MNGQGVIKQILQVYRSETLRRLKGSGISCPPPDPALLRRYLDYCVDIGFLPHPSTLGGLEWS